LQAIVTYNGEILDGRNRLIACEMAGVEPQFDEWDGDSTPTERVISGNLMRRDLTPGQKAMIGADLLPLLKEEATDRQRLSKGRGKKGAKSVSTISGKASAQAAKYVGANSRYVELAEKSKTSSPEIAERVRGGEITIPAAIKLAQETTQTAATGADNHIGRTTGRNEIETPLPLCQFLHDLIKPVLNVKTILDPCAGNGILISRGKIEK